MSNEFIIESKVNRMFDMREIGKRIARLRKENNLTQVELADQLGVTYQAISNWERGDSMPDIAKLSDLSKIFDVSIDELLGNERQAEVVQTIIDKEEVKASNYEEEDLKSILPLVKPDQFKESFKDFNDLSWGQFIVLLPFLEQEQIDQLAETICLKNPKSFKLITVAPFMSREKLVDLFKKYTVHGDVNSKVLVSLAPFLGKEDLDPYIHDIYKEKGVRGIVALLPFISTEVVEKIFKEEMSKGSVKDVVLMAPFLKGKFDFGKAFNFKFHTDDSSDDE